MVSKSASQSAPETQIGYNKLANLFNIYEDLALTLKIQLLLYSNEKLSYGSMVVYVTKGSDAARLLQGQYFNVAGESAYTRVYEPRSGPRQCYQCQELGHKAFACTKSQVCAKCAQEGHHHSDCRAKIPKCALCGGPHELFSKSCCVLHPSRHQGVPEIYLPAAEDSPHTPTYTNRQDGGHPTLRGNTMGGPIACSH